jgi:hypothetical protein
VEKVPKENLSLRQKSFWVCMMKPIGREELFKVLSWQENLKKMILNCPLKL